jgi:mannose-6-phosphate isomerase-like protein (cupin superfamily)
MSDWSKVNLLEIEDAAPGFGLETVSFRGAREALGGERVALSRQTVAPGARQPFGHRHAQEEEIYVILSGTGRLALGDEVLDVAADDAIRVGPGVARAFEAGPQGLVLLAFGTPGAGGQDAEPLPGWWPGESG